jgi:ribosomal protein S18 acetylase RimI-like enzyme
MSKSIQLRREKLSPHIVHKLLLELDPQFAERLSKTVVLSEYAKKLSEHAYFVSAQSQEGYLGICAYYINNVSREYFIPYICIGVSHRNVGVAGSIMKTICEDADLHHYKISLEVRNDNIGAINLYHKYGFVEVSVGNIKTSMARIFK